MLEKIRRFMLGRYGIDEFGKFLIILSVVIMGISSFVIRRILYPLSLIILLYNIYRMMSKDNQRRYKEKYTYLRYKNKLVTLFNKIKYGVGQRKIYHIYKCPSCKQKLRVPKGKGNITITCSKCKAEFKKKS